jgi:glycerol-3-phosphate acyltransferase PlsY
MQFATTLLLVFASYLIGSIPTGYLIAKWLKGIDIRQHGSGSTGATNVLRCVGKGAGISVFLIDALKGFVPAFALIAFNQANVEAPLINSDWVAVLLSLAALLGHSKSIFLNLSGGKSAATGLGTLFALDPRVGALTFAIFLVVLALSRIVSVASLSAVFCCAFLMYFLKAPIPFVIYCILGCVYVFYLHRANLKRLLAGTEPRLGEKAKEASGNLSAPPKEPPPFVDAGGKKL